MQHRDLAAPPYMGSAAARDGRLGRVLFASESYLLHTRLEDGNSVVTDTVYREQRAVGSERFLRASSRQVRAREQLRQGQLSSLHPPLPRRAASTVARGCWKRRCRQGALLLYIGGLGTYASVPWSFRQAAACEPGMWR